MSNALPDEGNRTGEPAVVPAASLAGPPDPSNRQQAVVAMGRRAIAPPDLSILMQDAASLIAETLGAEHRCVAQLALDAPKIFHILTRQDRDSTEPRVFLGESGTEGAGSLAGYALKVAHPVIVTRLSEERRFSDSFLEKHGMESAIAVPLRLEKRSFGALIACTSRVHPFDTDDVLFVETVAHLITTTIARVHSEKALAEERRLSAEVFQTVGAMVLVLDAQGRIVRVNRACEKVAGFSLDEIRSRTLWEVFPTPKDADRFHTIFAELRQGVSPLEYESLLLTKHSEQRWIRWSYAAVPAPDGSIESIIATGIDITAQRQAEQKAAKAKRVAESARLAIERMMTSPSDESEPGGHAAESERPGPDPDPLEAVTAPIHRERRRRPRLSYPYRQFVAPVLGGKLPGKQEFLEIECSDIASGGFSFLSATPPQSETLVVGLGNPPKLTYLTAQVVHVTRVDRDGRRVFLVGCNYTGRAAF
jgi:PAS domain S-box-containing protein